MRQFRADLHMHSNWSDGSQTVGELIKQGKSLGMKVMAITDYDTSEGQEEVVREAGRQRVAVITGIEISACDPITKRKVSVLGYNCSDAKRMNDTLLPYLSERNNIADSAIKRIQKAGYDIDWEVASAYAGKGKILYQQHIMQALIDRGYCLAIYGELYDKIFGRDGIVRVDSHHIPVTDAVKLIKSCRGSAVLAHPYKYDSLGMLPKLKSEGLDGLEVFHPSHSPLQRQSLLETAQRYELFITGGSDTHGFYTERTDSRSCEEFLMDEDHPLLKGEVLR